MLSFTKYLIEQKQQKEFNDLFNGTNQHLYHINELFLFDKKGLTIAKQSLMSALRFLNNPSQESKTHISLKFDGSISIVFGYVPEQFLYQQIQDKVNSLVGMRKETYLDQIQHFDKFAQDSQELLFVIGYKAALENPIKWCWNDQTITQSDYPENVQDLFRIILNNHQDLFQKEFKHKPFLIQCDVLFHDRNEQTTDVDYKDYGQPTFKKNSIVTKPNLITYEIENELHQEFKCGLVPHTFYKVTDHVQSQVAKDDLIDSMFAPLKTYADLDHHLTVLGTKDVYVLNYKLKDFLEHLNEGISPKQVQSLTNEIHHIPLANSLSYYYYLKDHLKDIFLKYFNHVIFKGDLVWNRTSEKYESSLLRDEKDFIDFLLRREYIFPPETKHDKITKKIEEKINLSNAYHKHVDEFFRMVKQVLKTYLYISTIKQKIWMLYHERLTKIGKIKPYYHQLYQNKYIPISHEGLVITEGTLETGYKTKMVPQHEFSQLNFTAGTQSKFMKPLTAKENDQFVSAHLKDLSGIRTTIKPERIMVVSVGRLNPPTIGHSAMFIKLKDLMESLHVPKEHCHLISTETEGNPQNPLPFKVKDEILKKIVQGLYHVNDPKIISIIKEKDSICPHSVVEELSQQLIAKNKSGPMLIIYVGGSEYVRGSEEELAKKLQMVANNLGVYFIFVKSGERDDESTDVLKSISASKIRKAIKNDDYVYVNSQDELPKESFKKGTKIFYKDQDKIYFQNPKTKIVYQCFEPQELLATTISKDSIIQKEILEKTRSYLG